MERCLDRWDDLKRNHIARMIVGLIFIIICCVILYFFTSSSNQLLEERAEKESHLKLLFGLDYVRDQDDPPPVAELLAPYLKSDPKRPKCDYDNPPDSGKTCEVNLDQFGPCSPKNKYGSSPTTICMFLKFRRDPKWNLTYFNDTASLPAAMPTFLVDYIHNYPMNRTMNVAWISCETIDKNDTNKIGAIKYVPEQGFPDYQIPSLNESDLDPLIAISFQNITNDVIPVLCQLWTKQFIDELIFSVKLEKS